MKTIFMILALLAFSLSPVGATTWECGSGVDYSTGVPSGDWVRSCDMGDPDDINSAAYDLSDGDDGDGPGEDDDETD